MTGLPPGHPVPVVEKTEVENPPLPIDMIEAPCPEWAEKMGVAAHQSMFETMSFTDPSQSSVGAYGALLGHLLSFAHHIKAGGKIYLCITKSVEGTVRPGQFDSQYEALATKILDTTGHILKEIVPKMSPSESQEFHKRYKEAFETGCVDEEGLPKKFPPNGRLYHLMRVHWRHVESLKNRAEVYEWVCRELGETHAPSREAFMQICKRFGVKLAKPGHPSK